MVFYFLTGIVFIAEIIIAVTITANLIKLDKNFCLYNKLLDEIKPKLKDILSIIKKISEQMVELAPIITAKIKSIFIGIIKDQLKGILAGLTFWIVKQEVEKRI